MKNQNLKKYNNVFIESFEVSEDKLNKLKYESIPKWDWLAIWLWLRT